MSFDDSRDVFQRPGARFRALSASAQLAILLGIAYLCQFLADLVFDRDPLARALALRMAPLDWTLIYRPLTYAFVHKFDDPLHVIFNAIGIFAFGTVLQSERGPRTMLMTFGIGVLVGGVAFGVTEWGSPQPVVGASGGVFALLVAAAVVAPHVETLFRIPLWVIAAIYVGMNLLQFAQSFKPNALWSPVSHITHLGGAAAGFVMAARGVRDRFDAQPFAPMEWLKQKQKEREVESRRRDEEELDRLLEKIHQHGLPSLTAAERKFLQRASKNLHGSDGSEPRTPRDGTRGR
ncbi:MAG: rhomboid family intramembrane serine protease [Planctomycetes bacterium]|nr:rhomboid family intramembrane serine protease [Planctomycetota bacterium]